MLTFPTNTDFDSCLLKDRIDLRRRLNALKNRQNQGKSIEQDLLRLYKAVNDSKIIYAQRQAALPVPEFPPELPISNRWEEIGAVIAKHQVTIICGETGSGKSTQLPKICLALGRGIEGRIGHTQPRRIAARSLATRISQELGRTLGTTVGYKVRFQDRIRPETQVKLMTDGILLAEIQQDRRLYEYDTLILDEAHERSLNIDFLLGYLQQLLPRRPELKLVITSATIDPKRFSQHFNHAPIIEVSGRTYPVEVRYRPLEDENLGELDDQTQQAICQAVDELSLDGRGDILIFLSGEREIRETAETLRKYQLPATEILPLYARLGPKEQGRIFAPHGARRIILATNVAETSLTVPGIRYVIDAGMARISRYSPRSKVQRLPVERISQAAAEQRKGRCGRLAPGICIRLYSEDNFTARRPFTEPEIQRTNLAAVILQMRVLGFGEIEAFPFLESPDTRFIADGYRLLWELQAVDVDRQVTPLGRQLARLPVDPRIGRMLLAAVEARCLAEVAIIAAALTVQDPRERPLERREAADQIHASFNHIESDFLSLLNLWRFLAAEQSQCSKNQFRSLCERHFLSWTRVIEWQDTQQQLLTLLHEPGLQELPTEYSYDAIHLALLTGLLSHVGLRDEDQTYQGVRSGRFWIHPGSGQFRHTHKWIMAAERVQTTKDYGRIVARIRPDWIEQTAAHLVTREYSEPHWQASRGQVAAFEKVTFFGLVLATQRRVNYGPINPAEARAVFIRSALVDRDFTTSAPFFRHNQELIIEIELLEAKARRRDFLVDDEVIQAFYEARIPAGIASGPDFERWLREASHHDPKCLHMRTADLLQPGTELIRPEYFPDHLDVSGTSLPLEYRFEPGHPEDGITLITPVALINQIPIDRCEWLVPGLLETLVITLMRGLPKTLRKLFLPIPETASRVVQHVTPTDRPLLQSLGEALFMLTGVQVAENSWDLDVLPEHLRLGFRIIDDTGRVLAWSRDFTTLRRTYGGQGRREFASILASEVERTCITRWDFGTLPKVVRLNRGGIIIQGYPALVDDGQSVALRVLDSQEYAVLVNRIGLRKLAILHLPAETRQLRKNLIGLASMRLRYSKVPPKAVNTTKSPPDLEEELLALILDRTFFNSQLLPDNASAFTTCLDTGKAQLANIAKETCKWAGDLLAGYQRLRLGLAAITQAQWQPSVLDMHSQLDGLIYRGFFQEISDVQLRQYPRYIAALETRLARLSSAAARDRQRVQELIPLLTEWQLRRNKAEDMGKQDLRLEEIRWMLEELRVSLFAQPQPTAYPISIQRLEKRWRELGL